MPEAPPGRTGTVVVRTPEGIVFSLRLAGPITRFLAWAIDAACIAAAGAAAGALGMFAGVVSRDAAFAAVILTSFAVSTGYGIVLEWYWRGQTLGKKLLHLRVMDEHGLRLQPSQIVVRNLLRFVDALPLFYLVGGVASVLGRHSQRLGDLAAGTIVVRTPPSSPPDLRQVAFGRFNSFRRHPHLVARLRQRLTPDEAAVALGALMRREALDPLARVALFRDLAGFFRSVVPFPPEATDGLSDEQYVRNVAEVLYRSDGGPVSGETLRGG